MKYKITAIMLLLFLLAGTALNIRGNIAHIKPNYSERELSPSLIADVFKELKENEATNISGQLKISFFNASVQGALGKKYIYDPMSNVVKLNNGFLGYGHLKSNDGADPSEGLLAEYAPMMSEFDKKLEENGMDLLYVQVAPRVPTDKYTPYDAITCVNPEANGLIDSLDEHVEYIRMSDEINSAGLDFYDLFYKTDHHWNADAGLFTMQKICEKLNYDVDARILDESSYIRKTVKNSFLGSIGRRVGDFFAGHDDFTVLYPNFDTNFIEDTKGRSVRTGSFEDTVIHSQHIPAEGEVLQTSYSTFCGGDFGLQVITNHNSTNDKKILLLRDSNGGVVSPYLSLICSELHIIDLRHYEGISVLDYAKQADIDDVVIIYNVTSISDRFFNFYSEIKK